MAAAAEATAAQGAMVVEGATVEAEAIMAAGGHMGEAAAMAGAIQQPEVVSGDIVE